MSLLLNSECYEHCPEVVAAFRRRGDEIVGHGRTNSEHQNDFDEAGERKLIADVTEAIRKHEGKPPAGWLSPGVNPSKADAGPAAGGGLPIHPRLADRRPAGVDEDARAAAS